MDKFVLDRNIPIGYFSLNEKMASDIERSPMVSGSPRSILAGGPRALLFLLSNLRRDYQL
jgi:hypothetical protein